MREALRALRVDGVDRCCWISASSMHLDRAERPGFIHERRTLDMRMAGRATARDVVNAWPEENWTHSEGLR